MHRPSAIQLALSLLTLGIPVAQAATAKSLPAGDVFVATGIVEVAHGKSPENRVSGSEAIFSSSVITTGDRSVALVKFADGQIVGLQENSGLRIRNFQYSADKPKDSMIVLSMIKGSARFITGEIGQQNKSGFRLATPYATVGVRGTDFMLTMQGAKMYGHVQSGSIAMTNAAGMTVVGSGQNVLAASSATAISVVPASAVPSGLFSKLLAMPITPDAIASVQTTPAAAPVEMLAEPLPAETLSVPPAIATLTIPPDIPDIPAPVTEPPAVEPPAAAAVAPAITAAEEEIPAPTPEPQAPAVVETIPEAPPAESRAEEPADFAAGEFGTGIAGKIGTLGYGTELAVSISDNLVTARFGLNRFNYSYNTNSSEINYDFKLKLQTASALFDIYPFHGSFRTTLGLMYNNNGIDLTAKPAGATYTINGQVYPTSEIDSVIGSIEFGKTAPYLGIGWGNPVAKGKGWGMVTDIGVLFQGSPKTRLTAHCAVGAPTCTQSLIQANVDAENAKLQNDLRNFKYWPVASIGISYQW